MGIRNIIPRMHEYYSIVRAFRGICRCGAVSKSPGVIVNAVKRSEIADKPGLLQVSPSQ
jgi:hypothetical protein